MKRIKPDDDKTPEQKAHEAIFKFCIYSGLDFNIVRSPYFQAMIDAISLCGPGYTGPSPEALKGMILVEAVQEEKGQPQHTLSPQLPNFPGGEGVHVCYMFIGIQKRQSLFYSLANCSCSPEPCLNYWLI